MAVLCTNCSGKLIFNPASQKLECAACGSSFTPEDVRDFNADMHSRFYDTRVYSCVHCGAEIITSDTEVSTFCVYCGNPAIVFSRISKEYRPDGIIPFSVTKGEAVRNIKIRFMKNPFIPKEIKAKAIPENLRGIYIPYWVANVELTEADFLSGTVRNHKRDEKRYYERAGVCRFKNVPVDGSKILNDNVSMRLEPFFLEESKEFDEDYLNGFYSNTSDTSYTDLRESAANRCHKLFSDASKLTVAAKDVTLEDSMYWADVQDDPIYMMMPVWFFTFRHEDKPYTILINGQSGKVVGTMPWSTKQIKVIAGTVFGLVMTVLILLFFAIYFNLFHLSSFYNQAVTVLMILGSLGFATGLYGIKKIKKNLELTQAEDIFKFVKKRQA